MDTVDDTPVSETPPWGQSSPKIDLSLTKYEKDCTAPETYKLFRKYLQNTQTVLRFSQMALKKLAAEAVSSVAANSHLSR